MKQLFEITKWIGSIAGVTAIIAGLAVSNYKAQQDREALKVGQSQQRELTDSLLIEMRSIKVDVMQIKTAQVEQGREQTMIKNYVIKHFSMDKSITKDDMLQLFRDFEKKKVREQFILDSTEVKNYLDTTEFKINVKKYKR